MDSQSFLQIRPKPGRTREAVVAGLFYPTDKTELAVEVDRLVDSCGAIPAFSTAILSPHGSLEFSGLIEAAAWLSASLRRIKTIVIASPSHRPFDSGIFLPESQVFSVPTADFKVDKFILEELLHSSTGITEYDIPHLEEHSIEMQLVMAAHFFPKASIVPIIASKVGPENLDVLFSSLRRIIGHNLPSTLFVLSSNLAVAKSAEACDVESKAFLAALDSGDISSFIKSPRDRRSFCGSAILGAFLRSDLSKGLTPHILGLSNSALLSEDGDPIVGYSAVGFSR